MSFRLQRERFCPDQGLLSKNFHPRPNCRQKSFLRKSGVGDGGQNLTFIAGRRQTIFAHCHRFCCFADFRRALEIKGSGVADFDGKLQPTAAADLQKKETPQIFAETGFSHLALSYTDLTSNKSAQKLGLKHTLRFCRPCRQNGPFWSILVSRVLKSNSEKRHCDENGQDDHFGPFWSSTPSGSTAATP